MPCLNVLLQSCKEEENLLVLTPALVAVRS